MAGATYNNHFFLILPEDFIIFNCLFLPLRRYDTTYVHVPSRTDVTTHWANNFIGVFAAGILLLQPRTSPSKHCDHILLISLPTTEMCSPSLESGH